MYEKGAKLSHVDDSVRNDLLDRPPRPAVFPVGPFFLRPVQDSLAGHGAAGSTARRQKRLVVEVDPIEEQRQGCELLLLMQWTAPTRRHLGAKIGLMLRSDLSPLMATRRPPAARNRLPLFPQQPTFAWPSLTSGFDPKEKSAVWTNGHRTRADLQNQATGLTLSGHLILQAGWAVTRYFCATGRPALRPAHPSA